MSASVYLDVAATAGLAALTLLACQAARRYARKRRERREALTETARDRARSTGWQTVTLAAIACGPCNDVPFTRTCTCAGYCGHQRCKGAPVRFDLAGALARITGGGGGRG